MARPFYRWLHNNYRAWFPTLPERTRLFRLFSAHADWTEIFLAQPTTLGVIDSYGIELRHPWRADRTDRQIGGKGLSNHCWIVGAKLTYLINQYGLIVAWDYAAANVADNAFQPLIAEFQDEMIILADTGFHAKTGDPANMQLCRRSTRASASRWRCLTSWSNGMAFRSMLTALSISRLHNSACNGTSPIGYYYYTNNLVRRGQLLARSASQAQ